MIITFRIRTSVWLYPGKAAWHFVTLPQEIAKEIDFYFSQEKRGWGSLPVSVTIGETTWKTSIFPDKKSNSYLLPLKAAVRKKEKIKESETIELEISVGK